MSATNHTATKAEELLTEREAASALGVCRQTLCNWRKRGVLPYVKQAGTRLRFRRRDVDAILQGRATDGAGGLTT
jgi:excisionase family DNA binding protein